MTDVAAKKKKMLFLFLCVLLPLQRKEKLSLEKSRHTTQEDHITVCSMCPVLLPSISFCSTQSRLFFSFFDHRKKKKRKKEEP
jgi:hypothetical protein